MRLLSPDLLMNVLHSSLMPLGATQLLCSHLKIAVLALMTPCDVNIQMAMNTIIRLKLNLQHAYSCSYQQSNHPGIRCLIHSTESCHWHPFQHSVVCQSCHPFQDTAGDSPQQHSSQRPVAALTQPRCPSPAGRHCFSASCSLPQ